MPTKNKTTNTQIVNSNDQGVSAKKKIGILIYSALTVFSFVNVVFFTLMFVLKPSKLFFFYVVMYLITGIGSWFYLSYYYTKENGPERGRTDIAQPSV